MRQTNSNIRYIFNTFYMTVFEFRAKIVHISELHFKTFFTEILPFTLKTCFLKNDVLLIPCIQALRLIWL